MSFLGVFKRAHTSTGVPYARLEGKMDVITASGGCIYVNGVAQTVGEAELDSLDGVVFGTASANKAVILGASKQIATLGAVTMAALSCTTIAASSTTTLTGALTCTGAIICDSTTGTTSGTTGSIQTDGGLGVAENIWVAGNAMVVGTLTTGATAAGTDVLFYGSATSHNLTWDANVGLLIGANTHGVDVSIYGDTTAAGMFWDANGDTNGSLTFGVNGTGCDVKMFGDTAGAYMLWDQSGDELIITGGGGLVFDGTQGIDIARAGYATYAMRVGNYAGSLAAGSGVVFTANLTGLVKVYGESTSDLTSAYNCRSIVGRHLVSCASDTVISHETYGIVGQLCVLNGSLNHYHGGVMGTFETNTDCDVQTSYGVGAVVGRIGGAGLTVESGGLVAGFLAVQHTAAWTATGTIAAFATKLTVTGASLPWPIGLYFPTSSVTTAVSIGTCTTGVTVAAATNCFVASVVGTGTDGWLLRGGATATHFITTSVGSTVGLFVDCSATSGSNRVVYVETLSSGATTALQNFGGRFASGIKTGITSASGAWNIGVQGKIVSAGTHVSGTTTAAVLAQLNNSGTWNSGATLCGLSIDNQLAATPGNGGADGNFWMLSVTNANSSCLPTAAAYFYGAFDSFMHIEHTAGVWMGTSGTCSTAGGFLKVITTAGTRYIPLFTTLS